PTNQVKEAMPEGITFQGHFELKEILQQLLSQLGDMCKQLLIYWAEGYKMKEIATKMHIVSDTAVRKRKHSCLKKLLAIVNQDEEIKTVLQNYLHES
ncbi:MAG TPA: hypothetical protein VJ917_07270, partial [Saprospiraceae bacterium]|nr:hypothetical protein [Saprospiraceae bacterium]